MDIKGAIKPIIEYLLKTGFKRFLTGLIVIGAGLVSLSWIDVVIAVIDRIPGDRTAQENSSFGQLIGVGLILFGIVARIFLHLFDKQTREQRLAGALIGHLRVVANGFRDVQVPKDAGYFHAEIVKCSEAAKAYLEVAPRNFSGEATIKSIANPKFDASGESPYFDLSVDDLDQLITKLGSHYGIQ